MKECECLFWESCRTCKYPGMSDAEILKAQILQLAQIVKGITSSDRNLDCENDKTRDLVVELENWE